MYRGLSVIAIVPVFNSAYQSRDALLLTGRTSEAMDEYEHALRINPVSAETHNNLGNALVQTGRASEAIDHFHRRCG